jgi:hypothetical protein
MSEQFAGVETSVPPGWRRKIGLFLFILALLSPLLVPLLLTTDLPREMKAAFAGLLLFGLPMGLMLVVVALLGQPAFLFLRSRIAKESSPPSPVSLIRYRIGLVLLVLPVLVSWITPLVSIHVSGIEARRVLIGAPADGVLLLALFVLGGQFWDKVRALFDYHARVAADVADGVASIPEKVQMGRRFYLGSAVFIVAEAAWLLVPIASVAGWSTARVASLSGGVFVANKVGLVTAIAILGKAGFNHLKWLLFGLLRKLGPPQQVSHRRYRLGLILFMVPVLMAWIEPYTDAIVGPGSIHRFLQDLPLELLALVALFLLGGEFWDKVRALFRHGAKVEFVAETSTAPS